jgi:hypothetical protein
MASGRRPRRHTNPPAGIASGPTLMYAIVPPSIRFVNRGRFIVDGKTFPGAPRVFVARDMIQRDYDLLFCDGRWRVLAGTSHATLEGIKAEAERFYPGLTPYWVDLAVDDLKAHAYVERLRGRIGCSFCRRLPAEFARGELFEVGHSRICADCVRRFWQDLNESHE